MSEDEFIALIDCRFPYHDDMEAQHLIRLACSVSSNAAFTVVFELARPPATKRLPRKTRLALLQQLDAHFDHPLKDLVFHSARRAVNGRPLSLAEVLEAMEQIAPYQDQYQALNVVQDAGAKAWPEVDDLRDRIVEQWRRPSEPTSKGAA